MFSIFAFMSEWVEFYAVFGLNITIYYSIVHISIYREDVRGVAGVALANYTIFYICM